MWQEIDSVVLNNLVYFCIVGYFLMVNSMVFECVGVSRMIEDLVGGKFECDVVGELIGLLVEIVIEWVEKVVLFWIEDDEMCQFMIVEGVLNSFGIMSVIEGVIEVCDIWMLQKFVVVGKVILCIGVMFCLEFLVDFGVWEVIIVGNGVLFGFGDDWFKFVGIKIFYDGGMMLKIVLMCDVYLDLYDNYYGIIQQMFEWLKQFVFICNCYDWCVGVYVVGDFGIDQVFDVFEVVDKEKLI